MPNSKCRADGAARIAGRRLYVDASEWCHPPHLAVGDGVHRTTAGQREVGQSAALLQHVEKMKECLLIHRLDRSGDVAMAILKRVGRLPPRPQQLLERRRKQIAELRRSVRPLIGHVFAMMAEEFQIELEAAVWKQAHNLPHGVQKRGAAVRRKSHHLVLVAIMRKAEILRERLIEDAERMREIYSAVGRDFAAICRTPSRA